MMSQVTGLHDRLGSIRDLIGKYFHILRAAWTERNATDVPRRRRYELAFLPSALEMTETPVHPAPYWIMYTISGMVSTTILMSIFGHLDIVVAAKGKVLPNERVKTIQPAVTGVVRQILVQDGERVRPSQVLVELDPVQADADAAKTHTIRVGAELTAARARALLSAQERNHGPLVFFDKDVAPEERVRTQELATALYREYSDKVLGAEAELSRREAELESTRFDIESLRKTAPLSRKEANDNKVLADKKFVAAHEYMDKEQTAIQQEQDLLSKQSHAKGLLSAIQEQRNTVAQTHSEFRREQLDAYEKAMLDLKQDADDENKAVSRAGLMRIVTPVAGTVQHLTVHTVGGVVTTAQNLMEVVPDDALEVEANVENKDVGFVQEGQQAVIKVESFPYARFGYLLGTVRSVSNDAIQDNKQNLTFTTRVHLRSNRMFVQNRWINLVPGMAVSIEIKTGQRTVLEFFLDPLIRDVRESMHER